MNAAMEAAHQMLQMAGLGDSSKLTTVNFKVINSGDRTNVIPDTAMVRGDLRVREASEFDRMEKDMARLYLLTRMMLDLSINSSKHHSMR